MNSQYITQKFKKNLTRISKIEDQFADDYDSYSRGKPRRIRKSPSTAELSSNLARLKNPGLSSLYDYINETLKETNKILIKSTMGIA